MLSERDFMEIVVGNLDFRIPLPVLHFLRNNTYPDVW